MSSQAKICNREFIIQNQINTKEKVSVQHVKELVLLEVSFKYLFGRKSVLFKKKGTKKNYV